MLNACVCSSVYTERQPLYAFLTGIVHFRSQKFKHHQNTYAAKHCRHHPSMCYRFSHLVRIVCLPTILHIGALCFSDDLTFCMHARAHKKKRRKRKKKNCFSFFTLPILLLLLHHMNNVKPICNKIHAKTDDNNNNNNQSKIGTKINI